MCVSVYTGYGIRRVTTREGKEVLRKQRGEIEHMYTMCQLKGSGVTRVQWDKEVGEEKQQNQIFKA